MKIYKNALWMTGSTGFRLLSGVLLFVLLARMLGANTFGVLMAHFSAAYIIALPVNFGLSIYVLREVPISKDGGQEVIRDAVSFKIIVSILILALMLITRIFYEFNLILLALLYIMHATESFTDLFCAHIRSKGNFDIETKFASKQALIQFSIISISSIVLRDLNSIAISFLLSRLISLGLIWQKLSAQADLRKLNVTFLSCKTIAKKSSAYFADFGIQSTLIQIDVVLLNYFSGYTAVGLYQAAIRIAHGVSQAITILVNVLLPTLSKKYDSTELNTRGAAKVGMLFLVAGITLASPVYFLSDFLSVRIFGASYNGLSDILELVAMFIVIRFAGAGGGLLLIASGNQSARATIMFFGLLGLLIASWFFMPAFGARGAVLAMMTSYTIIALLTWSVFFYSLYRSVKNASK